MNSTTNFLTVFSSKLYIFMTWHLETLCVLQTAHPSTALLQFILHICWNEAHAAYKKIIIYPVSNPSPAYLLSTKTLTLTPKFVTQYLVPILTQIIV